MNNLLLEHVGSVAIITINRPDQLNALNLATIQELNTTLEALRNNNAVRGVIITGAGEKAFVAGADIKEFAAFDPSAGADMARNGQQLVFDYIEGYSKPVLAAINGFALGGGLELAMACHMRIAAETAKMGLPEVTLGIIPGYGGTQRLPQLVGKGKAFEMIFTGAMIGATEAHQWGLVNKVVSKETLMDEALALAQKWVKNAPGAIAKSIVAVNDGMRANADGYATEIAEFGSCFETEEFTEGTTAFTQKRKPNF
jgi:enoyl-CoA hydratase